VVRGVCGLTFAIFLVAAAPASASPPDSIAGRYRVSPPPNVAARAQTVLREFNGSHGDGSAPSGPLAQDARGALYGVTTLANTGAPGSVFMLAPASAQHAWTFSSLMIFNGTQTGASPNGVAIDARGNLFGTTSAGGPDAAGTVFELSPPRSGGPHWSFTTLWEFDGRGGAAPSGGLLLDATGNLFGMTQFGGAQGEGAVFELSPPAPGERAWTQTIVHSFTGGAGDGEYPIGGLIADAKGQLYGTTVGGGPFAAGTIFKLAPPHGAGAAWSETLLHSFDRHDGTGPWGTLTAGTHGTLYGVTGHGGGGPCRTGFASGCGTVFALGPPLAGRRTWTYSVLHAFGTSANDGALPEHGSRLVLDRWGALGGTTSAGGDSPNCDQTSKIGGPTGCGIAFRLVPPAPEESVWKLTVLHSFTNALGDGAVPTSGLVEGAKGMYFGATSKGGTSGLGTIFALSSKPIRTWIARDAQRRSKRFAVRRETPRVVDGAATRGAQPR
jgi:uncharacterized repeat protein (TIGR03803 family)